MHRRPLCVACVLIAVVAVVLALDAAALYGMGLDGDGVWMLSAGVNLAQGRGLVTCLDEVLSLWPPLYALVAAALELVGLDLMDGLLALHLAAFAATILLSARLAWITSESAVVTLLVALTIALSARMHEFAILVASEGFFLPLVLASLLSARSHLECGAGASLLRAIAFSALACLQRYLGVALVVSVAAGFVALDRSAPLGQRVRRAFLYGAGSLAPLFAWLLRNRLVDGRWTGGRDESEVAGGAVLADALGTLMAWIRPDGWPDGVGWFALACVAALVMNLLVRSAARANGGVRLLALFVVVYLCFVLGFASLFVVDRVSDRLLLPVLPPLVVLAWCAMHHATRAVRGGAVALALSALIALGAGAARLHAKRQFWLADGVGGFSSRLWREHEITRALAAFDLPEPCWSNAPEMLWILQRKRGRFLRAGQKAWVRAAEQASQSGGSLVWFQSDAKPREFLGELQSRAEVLVRLRAESGIVAVLSPR